MQKHEIQNLIKELVEKIVSTEGVLDVSQNENLKTTLFQINVKDPHLFLSREGEALQALNHVVRRMIEARSFKNTEKEDAQAMPPVDFVIDINGFQQKRIENIHAIVHMMAERARYFKSNIELDPMTAFERRIVHEFLSEATDLETESQGYGPSRKVIIKYIGNL